MNPPPNRHAASRVGHAVRPSWPAAVSVVLHGTLVLLASLLRVAPARPALRPAPARVDLDLAPPPPPPTPPSPPVPPTPVPPPTQATPAPARPSAPAAAVTPIHVLTAQGGNEPSPVPIAPPEPSRPDASVPLAPSVPPNLRAAALLSGARDLSLQMAGAQPTDEQRRQEIRAIALAPINEALHANDHTDPPGTARASAILTTRVAEEIASRISVPALTPEVDRAPSINLPRYNPQESAGERMAGSELDAVHANSFTSAAFGPGSPACSSYHALLVDLAFVEPDGGRGTVSLLRSSGVASLDRAVIEVARELVVEAAPPGTTRWRFELADDNLMGPNQRCSSYGGWRPLSNGGHLRVRFRRLHGR